MKKLFIIFPIVLVMLFSGCTNDGRLLARNLDNTITNLLYSISNLDVIDSEMLQKVNSLSSVGVNQLSDYQTVSADVIEEDENNESMVEENDDNEEPIEENDEINNEEIVEDNQEFENETELNDKEKVEEPNESNEIKDNDKTTTLRDNDANFNLPKNNQRLPQTNSIVSDNNELDSHINMQINLYSSYID